MRIGAFALLLGSGCLIGNPAWDPDHGQTGSGSASGVTATDSASGASQTSTATGATAATDTGTATDGTAGQTGGPADVGFVQLSVDGDHSCVLFNESVWCWGANDDGQLGDGTNLDRNEPVMVMGLPAATQASAGHLHSCAIAQGDVWCWGAGGAGQLGGGTGGSLVPTVAVGMPAGQATYVDAALNFTCAVASERAYCWGANENGQLGIGSNTSFATAQLISVWDSGVELVDCRNDHACALADGGAWCWGHNDGNVGLGAGVPDGNATSPLPVVGMDSGVTQLSMGGWGGCALQNGVGWCWGLGGGGELGDGLSTSSGVPVRVQGMDSAVSYIRRSGGPVDGDIGQAIRDDVLYTWGNNTTGRLGDGTTDVRSTPVAVDLARTPVMSDGGLEHACAATVDFRVYCWGRGTRGQLGNGANGDELRPVEVTPNWL